MSRQIQLSRVIPASGHFHAYPLHMSRTLRISSWSIMALAAFMTVFMSNHAMDSFIDPRSLLPVALLPYVALAFMIHRARTVPALVISLATALVTLGIGF